MPFRRPTLQQLLNRALADLSLRLSGLDPTIRWVPERVIATVQAGQAHSLHGHLDWIANQVIPDKADLPQLLRWANFFGLTPPQKPASVGGGSVLFAGTSGSSIPSGALMQRADGTQFKVSTTTAMVGLSSPVGVPVASVVAGVAANTSPNAPMSLVTAPSGVNGSGAVDSNGLTGGANIETPAQILSRFLFRVQNPPQGGADSDYVGWALAVSGVTRAWCCPGLLGLGTTSIYVVCDGQAPASIAAGSTTLNAVIAAIAAKRPVTDGVSVFTPALVAINPVIHIAPSNATTQEAVTAALQALLLAQANVGGSTLGGQALQTTIPLSQFEDAVGDAGGITDFTITTPAAPVVSANGSLPVLGTPTWT